MKDAAPLILEHSLMTKLTMFMKDGAAKSGIVLDNYVYDLESISQEFGGKPEIDLSTVDRIISSPNYSLKIFLNELEGNIRKSGFARISQYAIAFESLQFAPLLRPQMCHAIGLNYKYKPNRPPFVKDMLKAGSSICANREKIYLPKGLTLTHVSAELCAIISRKVKSISSLEEAKDSIGGYTIGNDVGAIAFARIAMDMASTCKSLDGFGPMGPVVVTSDSLDPTNVEIRLLINGELKVSGNTRDANFSIYEVVRDISEIMTLFPGDVIFLGAMGNEPLINGPGDVVECSGSGIGTLTNEFIAGNWSLSENYHQEFMKIPS